MSISPSAGVVAVHDGGIDDVDELEAGVSSTDILGKDNPDNVAVGVDPCERLPAGRMREHPVAGNHPAEPIATIPSPLDQRDARTRCGSSQLEHHLVCLLETNGFIQRASRRACME